MLRRWSASADIVKSEVGQGFPPGYPMGASISDEDLAVIYSRPRVEVEPEVVLPEPEVRARPATDVPRGAASVAKAATKAGFDTKLTYARGPRLDARVPEIVDSILLRAHHLDGRGVIACWIGRATGWKFDFAYTTTPYLIRVDSKTMRKYLQVSTQ